MDKYDVVIIGGGPGGYVAAIRAAQLGLRTACVDEWLDAKGKPSLGGTCLNVGCIPSKALLDTSHHYHRLRHEFSGHGIEVSGVRLDVAKMMARKEQVCATLTGGIAALFAKHKITWLQGHGRLLGENRIEVTPHASGGKKGEPRVVEAGKIVIATGSRPAPFPGAEIDGERIVDSTGALSFTEVPKRLAVIGGGVIGLELGSVWSRLGSKVTVLIRRDRFLPAVDRKIAAIALESLRGQGLDIRLGAATKAIKATKRNATVHYEDEKGEQKLNVDKVLVATGRRPNTEGLGAEEAGLELDQRGFIQVDDLCRTNLPGVYAIGDVVRGPMLAHKASEEGIAVAEHIAGKAAHVNYDTIPFVIYTWPEIAWVGKSADQLRDAGADIKEGAFPFKAVGRAHAAGDTEGLVKIVSDAATDTILGVHIIGPNASELIAEAVVAMEFSASAEDLARTIHAHPTLSEALHEAALAVEGRAIHI